MTKKITFTFDERKYSGVEGDTLASALIRNGVFLIGTAQTYTSGEDVLDIANNALYIPSNVYRVSAKIRL